MSVETTPMLLYAVAAVRVEPAGEADWFSRCAGAHAAIISTSEDALDIALRLPQAWNVVEGGRLRGLHDEADIMDGDARFSNGFDGSVFAIVGCDESNRYVALMQVNAAESVFWEQRLFNRGAPFETCIIW
ncbi:hypothetical protein E2553_31010 [Paraburkholderia dipogonis]|uniref:Uncharacterized protein n=1 Tax=Paraburkholderia dipogonis TaxID=1211383 RepID=A0A4Y8MUL3_9BURK|nr:hypothetical protein [Paraburkholderia dipogonis]TFE41124.1 hypothetical protein E2553_31010 [Paraburkholderia dipogonis]